jgi:hypothetical protein
LIADGEVMRKNARAAFLFGVAGLVTTLALLGLVIWETRGLARVTGQP